MEKLNIMSNLTNEIKVAVKRLKLHIQFKLADYKLENGKVLSVEDETGKAFVDGEPAEDGTYKTEDGKDLIIEKGVLVEKATEEEAEVETADEAVTEPEAEQAPDEATIEVDGTTYSVEDIRALLEKVKQAEEATTQLSASVEEVQARLSEEKAIREKAELELAELEKQPLNNPINLSETSSTVQLTPAQLRVKTAYSRKK